MRRRENLAREARIKREVAERNNSFKTEIGQSKSNSRKYLIYFLIFLLILIVGFAFIEINKSKPVIKPTAEFATTPQYNVRIGDDDRLYVSGYVDAAAVSEITEFLHGGVLSIEIDQFNGEIQPLLNFSKLVEIYKKPVVVQGACLLPCAVIASASQQVTFKKTREEQTDLTKKIIPEAEKMKMLKRLAELNVPEDEIKAAKDDDYDMSHFKK